MGNLNIGLAMVAARLATSKTEKEQEGLKNRENRATHPGPERRAVDRKPSLSGAKMEVVKGKLVLIPTGESLTDDRSRGWILTREGGSDARIKAGKVVHSPKPK
jgi:hypothetical protein